MSPFLEAKLESYRAQRAAMEGSTGRFHLVWKIESTGSRKVAETPEENLDDF